MKLQRYSIDGLHAYPEDNGEYIKVSELREWIKGMREGLNSKSDYQLGKLAILNDLLNGLEGE